MHVDPQQVERHQPAEDPALAAWRFILVVEGADSEQEHGRKQEADDLGTHRKSKPGNRDGEQQRGQGKRAGERGAACEPRSQDDEQVA